MVVGSCTFYKNLDSSLVISPIYCMLYNLVPNNLPTTTREAAASSGLPCSSCGLPAVCLGPPLPNGANTALASVLRH